MITIEKKEDCCGCNACYNICPRHCISMENDEEGFPYPVIDHSKCINCHLCEKVCPVLHHPTEKACMYSCAAMNQHQDIREKSSSGGIFLLLAEHVLEQGGVVYGAALDENFQVKHIEVTDIRELYKLRGSKYVQSSIGETYRQAQRALRAKKYVLFSGTPCQIYGLKNFLGKEYEKLFCIDVVCHGVPSPLVWEKYLTWRIQHDKGDSLKNIQFRAKSSGWKNFRMLFQYENGISKDELFSKNNYMRGFLQNIYLRPICYVCPFKGNVRGSDITLADYWGIQQVLPDMDDDRGTSAVMIRSEQGKKLFDEVKDELTYKDTSIDDIVRFNPSLVQSVSLNKQRAKFFHTLKTEHSSTIDEIIHAYTVQPLWRRLAGGIKWRLYRVYVKMKQ